MSVSLVPSIKQQQKINLKFVFENFWSETDKTEKITFSFLFCESDWKNCKSLSQTVFQNHCVLYFPKKVITAVGHD